MNDVISTERGYGPYLWLMGLLALACGAASLLVLSGGAGLFRTSPLVAEVQIEAMALPSAFQLDAEEIAADLAERLQRRATEDFALRTLLGNDGQQKVSEVVIPRLLNVGVIRRMIQEIPSLDTVTAVRGYQSFAAVTVTNHGETTLNDVALTMPGAVRAERLDGTVVEIVRPVRGIDVINLGALEPQVQLNARVWFEDTQQNTLAQRDGFLLAAKSVRSGDVLFRETGSNWFGADLEVTPWARWLVGTLAFGLCAAGIVSLVFSARAVFDARRRSRAKARVSRA